MKQNPNSEFSYIKSIMTKSEISFNEFKQFFFSLSIYSFVSELLLSLFRTILYSDTYQTGNNFRDIFVNTVIECILRFIALIPVLTIILVFRKKVKDRSQGISIWLFDIIGFVIVFCGSVLPFVSTAISASYESADLFTVITSALCMLLCGILTDSKPLKYASYIYALLPMIVLSIFGCVHLYNQYNDYTDVSHTFISVYSYLKGFSHILYPAIGYFIIALNMHNRSKGADSNEL